MIRWLGVVSVLIYAAICWLSFDFTYGKIFAERPILLVLFCLFSLTPHPDTASAMARSNDKILKVLM